MEENLWWGYLHTCGSVMPKRYFDMRDLQEARESSFVQTVVNPFPAKDRADALAKLWEVFYGNT